MLANPLEIRGRHRVNNMNPEADLEADEWGNVMAEAYTGNHTGHRVSRKHLKVDIVVRDGNAGHRAKEWAGKQRKHSTHQGNEYSLTRCHASCLQWELVLALCVSAGSVCALS